MKLYYNDNKFYNHLEEWIGAVLVAIKLVPGMEGVPAIPGELGIFKMPAALPLGGKHFHRHVIVHDDGPEFEHLLVTVPGAFRIFLDAVNPTDEITIVRHGINVGIYFLILIFSFSYAA